MPGQSDSGAPSWSPLTGAFYTRRKAVDPDTLEGLRHDIQAVETRLHQLQAHVRQAADGTLRVPMTARVDRDRCVGCGTCEEVCPVGAITVEGTAYVDAGRCIGCGACAAHCPRGAVILQD